MGSRFALLISPVLLSKYFFFFTLLGLWLLGCAYLLERVGDYESRLSRKIRRRLLTGNWLLSLRLGGTYLVITGSMALLLLTSHFRWPGKADAPLVVVNVASSQAAPTPPSPAIDAPHYEEMILVLIGGALLLFGSRYRRFVPAFAGSAMLLMGMTPTIKNEFRVDNHLKTEISLPGEMVETVQSKSVAIGVVGNFLSGCGEFAGSGCKPGQTLEFSLMGQSSSANSLFIEICKRKDLVFVVGRTDRVPLSPRLRTRYETNVGLAQSRAESVKNAILKFCSDGGLDTPTLLTEVAGPRHTPEAALQQTLGSLGHDGDRNVEITSLQSEIGNVKDPAARKQQQARVGRWGLLAVVVLAGCMALGTTKWSAALDLATGEARLEGERKGKPGTHNNA